MAPLGETPIRIFLVAENAALRQSVEILLAEEGMIICGWADDSATALLAMPTETEIVIVGLSRGGEGGLDLLREMATIPGSLPCLVLSANDDPLSINEAFAAGASAYVTNREAPEALAPAVRGVRAGRTREIRAKALRD